MSKKDLKLYLKGLDKEQLENQIIELYEKFKPIKTFYNFVFNPKENKLSEEAKFKISKEYFPVNNRKPKMRRSVAQKLIKHFIQLGVDNAIIADIMLYNIEVAQLYCQDKSIKQASFYRSMLKSFEQALNFIQENALTPEFMPRITKIVTTTKEQKWINYWGFEDALNR